MSSSIRSSLICSAMDDIACVTDSSIYAIVATDVTAVTGYSVPTVGSPYVPSIGCSSMNKATIIDGTSPVSAMMPTHDWHVT